MRQKAEPDRESKRWSGKITLFPARKSKISITSEKISPPEVENFHTDGMGSWELQIASGILNVSPDTSKLLGLKAKQKSYSLNDYLQTIHPDDRRPFLLEIENSITHKTSFTQTVRYLPNKDEVIYTVTKVEPFLEGKKLIKLSGIIMQINTASDQSPVVLSKEKCYQRLFELLQSGIILENRQGIIVDANPSFCRTMGYRREELIGKHVHILAHPDVRDQVNTNIAQLLAGRTLKHNVKSLHKDGSTRYMELRETKVTLPDGDEGILCIAEDFTDRVRMHEEQLQKEKFRGILEMAGAVCHELNQPLTTIFITTDLLLDFPKQPNIKEMLTVIKNEAMRIGKLTDKLMRITKYETRDYVNGSKIVDIDKAAGSKK